MQRITPAKQKRSNSKNPTTKLCNSSISIERFYKCQTFTLSKKFRVAVTTMHPHKTRLGDHCRQFQKITDGPIPSVINWDDPANATQAGREAVRLKRFCEEPKKSTDRFLQSSSGKCSRRGIPWYGETVSLLELGDGRLLQGPVSAP